MIKNKDPRIKQIRESFCRLKAQLLLNFMILKIPMGSALSGGSLFRLRIPVSCTAAAPCISRPVCRGGDGVNVK